MECHVLKTSTDASAGAAVVLAKLKSPAPPAVSAPPGFFTHGDAWWPRVGRGAVAAAAAVAGAAVGIVVEEVACGAGLLTLRPGQERTNKRRIRIAHIY